MKLNYSKRILLLSFLILIGILALGITFTKLLTNKIIAINDKVKQSTISSEARLKVLNLEDSITSTVMEREKFDQYFVGAGEGETAKFVTYLESLARSNDVNLNISFLNYEPVPDLSASPTVSLLRLKVNVSGHWSNVFSFLQTIEYLPKAVTVYSVSLFARGEQDEAKVGQIWSADLDFAVVKLKN